MKFLVDECVGSIVASWLMECGHDVVSICDNFPGISDDEVLKLARSEDRVLITGDKDFGEMIFKNNQDHYGVLLLRLLDQRSTNKIRVLRSVVNDYKDELVGNFVVVSEQSVRIIRILH